MGRASGKTTHAADAFDAAMGARRGPTGRLDMDAVFATVAAEAASAVSEPDWRTPGAFYVEEARQLVRDAAEHGVELDEATALRVLKLNFDEPQLGFRVYTDWYQPGRRQIVAPALTCAGMPQAGAALSAALTHGQTVAVYCDYDLDGTAAGEALRRGLAPYCQRVHYETDGDIPAGEGPALYYGYADAQQGFGLTSAFVNAAHAQGATVLVTLDCGTGQSAQVRLAQSLGMKVIVVDHHSVQENPADFHLNPKLPRPDGHEGPWPYSENTGAQLAWKLAASVQASREGKTRPEHWEHALHIAGMGCLADMGSVLQHENRAFFWAAAEHPVPGVRALAAARQEDPTTPGSTVTTQAVLNLPKRTANVSAADIGRLLACETEQDAAPWVAKLLDQYESAKPQRQLMLAAALEQAGTATRHDDGTVQRPEQLPAVHADYAQKTRADGSPYGPYPDYMAVAVLDEEFGDYCGYTGPVAQNLSRQAGKPAVVFAPRGTDEHGEPVYKFSSRNDSGAKLQLGGLIDDPLMRQACTLAKRDESDEIVMEPVCGGHDEVFSGSCTQENLPKAIWAMQTFAQRAHQANRDFWPTPWDGAEAYPTRRKVPAGEFTSIEQHARRLGPFTRMKQRLYPADPAIAAHKRDREQKHAELQLSVLGELRDLQPVDGEEKWLAGVLDLGEGVVREVRYPADQPAPTGRTCEWLLRGVGKPGAYYLRTYHDPSPPAAS